MLYKEKLTEWLKTQKIYLKYSTYTNYYNIIMNHIYPKLGDYEDKFTEILESKTTFAYKFFLFAISKNLSWIFHCAGMPVALGSLISAEIYST